MKKKKSLSVPHKENLDHLKEVPLKEDVDIEFEYKVYLLYEKLKKYKFFILGFFIVLFLAILSLFFYKNYQENKLNEASTVFYNLQASFEKGDYKAAEKYINKIKSNYRDTGYYKLAIVYELLIKKNKKNISVKDIDNLKNLTETANLKGYLEEYQAYLQFKNKKYDDVLSHLNKINQQNFNYISALTLKGIVLIKKGDKNYKQVLEEVANLSKTVYFKEVAINLLKLSKLLEDK